MDGYLSDPKKIIMALHVHWSHASAQQFRRVLVDPDGDNMHLATRADDVSEQREVRRASDRAPQVPIAGTSTVSLSDEKLQADLSFSYDLIDLKAPDVFSENSLPIPVRSKLGTPRRFGVIFASRGTALLASIGASRELKVGCGSVKRERICVQREGPDTISRVWRALHGFLSLETALREEFTPGRSRMAAFLGEGQTSAEVRRRLHTLISGGGCPAYQLVFGSNQVDLFWSGDTGEDLLLARDTSPSG